jgi:hypothetical protein
MLTRRANYGKFGEAIMTRILEKHWRSRSPRVSSQNSNYGEQVWRVNYDEFGQKLWRNEPFLRNEIIFTRLGPLHGIIAFFFPFSSYDRMITTRVKRNGLTVFWSRFLRVARRSANFLTSAKFFTGTGFLLNRCHHAGLRKDKAQDFIRYIYILSQETSCSQQDE